MKARRSATLRQLIDRAGDVVELVRQRTTGVVRVAATLDNQRGERGLEGRHSYLLRL